MTDWEALARRLADFIRDRMEDWPTEDVVEAEKLLADPALTDGRETP